jgi:hypothetical protein
VLKLTEDQMAAFRQDRLHRLDPKIDRWLAEQHASWAEASPATRAPTLREMVDRGERAGMSAETDYALYCDLMVRIGPDWRAFVESAPAREIAETDVSPPNKLNQLTDLAASRARASAR